MIGVMILILTIPGTIQPLSDAHRTALETAYDGRDHQEAAFAAMVDHVRSWTTGTGDAPIRLHPDVDRMIADPHAARGDLCRISGVLAQTNTLDRPYADVSEWFVRDDAGRPILVYVVQRSPEQIFQPGKRVVVAARFYKRVDMIARDGEQHSYPAFVGAFPRTTGSVVSASSERPFVILLPVAALGIAFLFLVVYIRRSRRSRLSGRRSLVPEHETRMDYTLPDDPAEALSELKRRAGSEL